MTVTPTDELGGTFDPVTYNAPAQNANLSLTKTDSPDPVLVGPAGHLHPDRRQRGPARRDRDVQVTDTLPAGMTFDSATPSQGTCSQTSGTVTCQLGTVANGAGATVTDQGPAAVDRHDQQHGHRRVERQRPDHRPTTPRAPRPRSTRPRTWRSRRPTRPTRSRSGTQLTYTVGVSNAGPVERHRHHPHRHAAGRGDVQLRHALAGHAARSRAARSPARSGTWRTPAARASRSRSRPQSAGTITNQANVTSLTGDPNTANNGATAQTTVDAVREPVADEDGRARPGAGRAAAHLQRSRSATPGPSRATGVTRDRHAAGGVTFDSATPSQGTCSQASAAPSPARSARSPTAASATVSIKVTPAGRRARSRTTASVASDAIDPTPGQQLGERDDDRQPGRRPVADEDRLARTRSLVGQQLTYTLGVQNAGPVRPPPASSLSDTLPAGVTFNSATPSQGSCSQSAGTVTCPLGHDRERRQRERPDQGHAAVHRLDHATRRRRPRASADPNSANNTASATTTVEPGGEPVADQVRLARPGARGPAADLHARRQQRRARRAPPA